MKILMCTPRMGIGGAETHILTLSAELVRRGHEVTVASAGGMLVPALEAAGVSHTVLPLDRKSPLCTARSLRGLRRAAKGCDVVHAHGRYPAFLCGILAKKADFPAFVTTAHGVTSPREPQRTLSRWGEGVLSVSDTVTAYLKKQHGVPAERIRFLPNGVQTSDTAAIPKEDPSRATRIAAAGRMEKDTVGPFLRLIAAHEALLDAGTRTQLYLFGDGNCGNRVRKAAERVNRKHPGAVLLPGPAADVRRALREYRADLFVGQSRAALEAMAEGIPTLLFSGCGCAGPLIPKTAEAMFRENYMPGNLSGNPKAEARTSLCEELRRFCGDAALRAQAAAFEQAFVREHNSLCDTAGQTEAFYADILCRHRPGVVLCGYFGAGNLGDEATLQLVSRRILKETGFAPCYVITRKPHAVPSGCTGIHRTDYFGIRKALRASRVFILCGGSLLQNSTSNRSLWYYTALFRAAGKAGLRTQIWGGGIGPLHGKSAEKRVRRLLTSADAAGLRDTASLEYASEFAPLSYLSADAVLGEPLGRTAAAEPTCFCVCPRKLRNRKTTENMTEVLAKTAAALQKQYSLTPVYWALSPEDVPLCAQIAALCPGRILRFDTPEEASAFLAECAFSLSVRLHGAVFSVGAGIPAVCLSYDPKVSAFAADCGLPWFPADSICTEILLCTVQKLRQSPPVLPLEDTLRQNCGADAATLQSLYFKK